LIAAIGSLCAIGTDAEQHWSEPRFQAVLDEAHAAGMPAVSVLMATDGKVWTGVAGESSDASGKTLSPLSRFRLASITKLVTATVVLQLVDEGRLGLDGTLADLLPGAPVADIPYAELVSVKQLLDHTSGIRSFTDIDAFWDNAYSAGGLDRTWDPADLISYATTEGPYFEPGAPGQRHYSNSNYVLLGMIIEKLAGEPLAQVFATRVFRPTGMENTLLEGFDPGMDEVQHSFVNGGFGNWFVAFARGWKKNDAGIYDVSGHYENYNAWAWAAGGLSSTPTDLNRLLVAVGDGSLLSAESEEILYRDNSAQGETAEFFGGSGGWDGIDTSAYEINRRVRVVVLVNGTDFDVDATTLLQRLYRIAENPDPG
jgi:D-alanyl-D-alanine carboxypeptidase